MHRDDTPDSGEWVDRSVLEAVSWRLASELVRRHPTTRIVHTHPGGGQYDCLTIISARGGPGRVELNRNGTIQIVERFDDRTAGGWPPTSWDAYLRADPRTFLDRLELTAGLDTPHHVPASTPVTLTYRVLAAIVATAIKTVHPLRIDAGCIDDNDGRRLNPNLETFVTIPARYRDTRDGDLLGDAGYRFWIVSRNDAAILAVEQDAALAWTAHHRRPVDLVADYRNAGRSVTVVAGELLHRADHF